MGHIISLIEKIENIRFEKLKKGRVYKDVWVLALSESTALVRLSNNAWAVAGRHHIASGNVALLGYGVQEDDQAVLHGFVRAGLLTKEEVAAHLEKTLAASKRRTRKYDIEILGRVCSSLGIPVPPVPDLDAPKSAKAKRKAVVKRKAAPEVLATTTDGVEVIKPHPDLLTKGQPHQIETFATAKRPPAPVPKTKGLPKFVTRRQQAKAEAKAAKKSGVKLLSVERRRRSRVAKLGEPR